MVNVIRMMSLTELVNFLIGNSVKNTTDFTSECSTGKGFCFFPEAMIGIGQHQAMYNYTRISDIVKILAYSGVISKYGYTIDEDHQYLVKFRVKNSKIFTKSRGRYVDLERYEERWFRRSDPGWGNDTMFWALEYCTKQYSKKDLEIVSIIDIQHSDERPRIYKSRTWIVAAWKFITEEDVLRKWNNYPTVSELIKSEQKEKLKQLFSC